MTPEAGSALAVRVEELESRVAFQEQTLDEVNQTLYQLLRENTELRQQIEHLAQRARELTEQLPQSNDDSQPPHY